MSCLAFREHKLGLQLLTAQYIFIIWRFAVLLVLPLLIYLYQILSSPQLAKLYVNYSVILFQSSLTQPQMLVVSDLDDIFIPLPDDLLVNLSESRSVVETFLDSLPSMFQDNMNLESAFGPALKAVFMILVC